MSSSILSSLVTPGIKTAVYAGNALWLTSAFIHFTFLPSKTLRRVTTSRTSGDALHHDILRYLGVFNLSGVVLALIRIVQMRRVFKRPVDCDLDVLAFAALGVANLSQCLMNFGWSKPSGRWIFGGFDRITLLDTVFSVLDLGSLALIVSGY